MKRIDRPIRSQTRSRSGRRSRIQAPRRARTPPGRRPQGPAHFWQSEPARKRFGPAAVPLPSPPLLPPPPKLRALNAPRPRYCRAATDIGTMRSRLATRTTCLDFINMIVKPIKKVERANIMGQQRILPLKAVLVHSTCRLHLG